MSGASFFMNLEGAPKKNTLRFRRSVVFFPEKAMSVLLVVAASFLAGLYGVFDRASTRTLLMRWKTRTITSDQRASISVIKTYKKACQQLDMDTCDTLGARFGVVDEHHNLFLLAQPTNATTSLMMALWNSHIQDNRDERFAALRSWHRTFEPTDTLTGEHIDDIVDRTSWYFSLDNDADDRYHGIVVPLGP